MRFVFTLNMPSADGNKYVQQVFGEHPATSLQAICDELADQGYVIVDEHYSKNNGTEFEAKGPTSIHERVVGKIREMR